MAGTISSKFITNCPTSQDIQQQYCAKNAVKAPEESAIVEYSELPHSLSIVQPPFSLTTPSATQVVLPSDYLAVACPREYFDKRFDMYAEKVECLSNEVVVLRNQNDELNRQIIYLKQHQTNTDYDH
ncbi:unnamed protein product [Rotaria socialis]|uniref:Uncharacterized protein n=1 Tax=Rotaria socialis TaxID=392032 RepID=A0A821WLE0_9BILA|nr:unnamed protein product [Rotaria socialis]